MRWAPVSFYLSGRVRGSLDQCKQEVTDGKIGDEHVVDFVKASVDANHHENEDVANKCQGDDDDDVS